MLAFLCNITIMFLQLMCFRILYFLFFERFVKFRTICLIDFMLFYFLFEHISRISVILHVQRSATDNSAAITFCKKKKQSQVSIQIFREDSAKKMIAEK